VTVILMQLLQSC